MTFYEEEMEVIHGDCRKRIAALEARLTKIYDKASACDPSHYNEIMTEIISLCCSAETACAHDMWDGECRKCGRSESQTEAKCPQIV